MDLKEKIYCELVRADGRYCSGEALAEKFGVSRNAVWKAVKAIEQEGGVLSCIRKRGYALVSGDLLTAATVGALLGDGFKVGVVKETSSTNDDARALAGQGAPSWTAVIAETQTSGRGRFSRPFYSPARNGLYMSVLMRPHLAAKDTLYLTTCAAVAVAEAIEAVSGKYAEIKWVNDVYIQGKKVSGILTEASFDIESNTLGYAIVGIGVNVRGTIPQEAAPNAASVFGEGAVPVQPRARLAAEILKRLRFYCEHIEERSFFEEYKRRCFVIGREVKVYTGSVSEEGVAVGLDENCFLKVRFKDGAVKTISAGEISIKVNF